jgi:hypothetical protein
MDNQNDSMRERLLARLPQPENLATYRAETAALLAKHEKALFWEKMAARVCFVIAYIMVGLWLLGRAPIPSMRPYFWPSVGFVYFVAMVGDLRYRFYLNKVDILKELKQVQLQILEMQASLQKQNSQ